MDLFDENPPRRRPAVADAQTDLDPVVTLEGVVERIVFESPDTGFMVARLRRENAPELDTFVGSFLPVSVGETARLRGRWIEDKKFGRQLRAESCETILPSTVEGIEKYLGSGLIQGIGPEFARRLVAAFGVETLRVIDEQPQRLRSVPGIGAKRADQIREAWASQKAVQSIMIFLEGNGVTPAQAAKIYQAYGDKALAVVRQNPYRLAQDIPGIAFAGADTIAGRLGIEKEAPQRLEAGLLHALWRAMGEGHVFLPHGELLSSAAQLLGVSEKLLDPPLERMSVEGLVKREQHAVFLPAMQGAEAGVAERLRRLQATPLNAPPIQIENALKWVEKNRKIALSPEQREAIRRGVTEKLLIITGGPGTGKTTVINSLLAILEKKGLSFVLAAPTGRAAKRMEQATGRDAGTLHRLLEFSPKTGGFTRDVHNPIHTDLVVVDEASMIDVSLMHALVRAVPPFARLLLVGDVDQLPAVGPGNVLLDCIASGVLPVVRLKTVFRQAAESGIITNAHRINHGEAPQFNETDFFLIQRSDAAKARDTIVELLAERIPHRFGLDPVRDIQVLSPMRRGDAGVNALNEALQEALNPRGKIVTRRSFRVGDKVMQLRNNYELEVYNGDTGVITLYEEDAGELEVGFDDGRRVIYAADQLDNLSLAYAATVHKAQGSEYPAVVLSFLPQHFMMLQRNVLYTAVTRAKQLVIIVGDGKAVRSAIRNTETVRRHTRLAERLKRR